MKKLFVSSENSFYNQAINYPVTLNAIKCPLHLLILLKDSKRKPLQECRIPIN